MAILVDLKHEHIDDTDVADWNVKIISLDLQYLKVVLQRVTNNGFATDNLLNDRLNIEKWWSIVEVNRFDTSDPLAIVDDLTVLLILIAWSYQGVKNDVAIEVDDGHPRKFLSFIRQNALTV